MLKKSVTIQELNIIHHICELERTQLITIIALAFQNHDFAGYVSTGIRSKFLYVEDTTACLKDCPHFFPSRYEFDKGYFCIPKKYQENVMYIDPIEKSL